MSKSLKNEINTAIYRAFRMHRSKTTDRANGRAGGRLYSIASQRALLDLTKQFSVLPAQDHLHLADLDANILQMYAEMFLEQKRMVCSQATLDVYRSNLQKLGKILTEYTQRDLNVKLGHVTSLKRTREQMRGAEDVISAADYAKILKYAQEHPSGSALAVQLERCLGVRVADLCYGVKIAPDFWYIRSKGGKICRRQVTPELRRIMKMPETQKYIIKCGEEVKLSLPKDQSINKWLRETEDRLGIDRHSFHSLRRFVAQEYYNSCRFMGKTKQQSMDATSVWLNHGADRNDLIIKSYVLHIW